MTWSVTIFVQKDEEAKRCLYEVGTILVFRSFSTTSFKGSFKRVEEEACKILLEFGEI